MLRIAAGSLFIMHGLEKFFSVGGGRIDRDIMTMRGLAGWLETVGGPLIILGLFTRTTAFVLSGEMAVAYFRSWAPERLLAKLRAAGHGSVDSVLLSVSVSLGGRSGRLEPRWLVAS